MNAESFDVTLLLAAILHRAARWVRTNHGYVCLVNEEINRLEVLYGIGVGTPYADATIRYGEGLGGKVWETGELIIVPDYGKWDGRVSDKRTANRPVAHGSLGVPLLVDGVVVGVIGLFYDQPERQFTGAEIVYLMEMGRIAGMVITQARQQPAKVEAHIEAFHDALPDHPDSVPPY